MSVRIGVSRSAATAIVISYAKMRAVNKHSVSVEHTAASVFFTCVFYIVALFQYLFVKESALKPPFCRLVTAGKIKLEPNVVIAAFESQN